MSENLDESTVPGPSRLHLGCGPKQIPGLFHIDALGYPHVDHVGAVDRLDFITDGSVEFIYACHVLEHFGRHETERVLLEWLRVLAPGGVLRLAVPDFAACARLYVDGALTGGLADILGLMVGGQRNTYDYHRMIFDESSLTKFLRAVGFTAVRRWDWRTVDHGWLDDYSQAYLPHMDKERGVLVSLNLEAIK